MMKMRRREKWWFHAIRGMNLWAFRYWWLFLLLFVGAIALFYYQCCPEKEENCAAWKTAIEKTRLALDASENCCNCGALSVWEDPDEFAREIEVPLQEDMSMCDEITQSVEGGIGETTQYHLLGSTPGTVRINYSMFTNPDEMIVSYNGDVVVRTDGPVQSDDVLTFYYPAHPGEPNYCSVQMIGHDLLGPGTRWQYTLHCPQ